MAIAAAKAAEEMAVVDAVADAAADEAGTAVAMVLLSVFPGSSGSLCSNLVHPKLRWVLSKSFITNMIFSVNRNQYCMLDVRQHCHDTLIYLLKWGKHRHILSKPSSSGPIRSIKHASHGPSKDRLTMCNRLFLVINISCSKLPSKAVISLVIFCWSCRRHAASAPSTVGTHRLCAVIRKAGAAWLGQRSNNLFEPARQVADSVFGFWSKILGSYFLKKKIRYIL